MRAMKVSTISPWFSPVAVLQYLPGHPRHPPALLPLVSTQLTVSVILLLSSASVLQSHVLFFCLAAVSMQPVEAVEAGWWRLGHATIWNRKLRLSIAHICFFVYHLST